MLSRIALIFHFALVSLTAASVSAPRFEQNIGQFSGTPGGFAVRTPGYALYLQDGAIRFLAAEPGGKFREIRMSAGKLGTPIGEEPLGSVSHHFRGAERFTGARHFGRVVYRDVYPGVDLQFRVTGKSVEYDFVVRPHASTSSIRMRFDGARVSEGANGELVLRAGGAELRHRKPTVYQEGKQIAGAFAVRRGEVQFRLGAFDPSKPLVIDPVVEFATLLGGGSNDYIYGSTTDSAGNIYLVGTTYSAPPYPFPNKLGVLAPLTPEGDVFVTKMSGDGKTLIWTAFLGGRYTDNGHGIALGSDGSVFVIGSTASTDFPTTAGVYQPQLNTQPTSYSAPYDAFVARLSAAGDTVLYSTFLGSPGNDYGYKIAVDASFNAYAAGNTAGFGFPTTSNALRATKSNTQSDEDVWMAKISPLGNSLLYGTYWGGTAGNESIAGIAVDSAGAVYLAGNTNSTDFVTTAGTIKPAANLNYYSDGDGFVTKFVPGSATPVYSTFFGGSSREILTALIVDATGNAYIAGQTSSYDFPIVPTPGTQPSISYDVFAAKLNPAATAILYSRAIPASNDDLATAIALDANGTLYVAGTTNSSNFPLVGTPVQTIFNVSDSYQPRIGFVMSLSPAGVPTDSTFVSGHRGAIEGGIYYYADTNTVSAISLLAAGTVVVSGSTNLPAFSTTPGVIQSEKGVTPSSNSSTSDGFVVRYSFQGGCTQTVSPSSINAPADGITVAATITTTGNCEWTSMSNVGWASVKRVSATQAEIRVLPSNGPQRTGAVEIAGKVIGITQANSCAYGVSPFEIQFGAVASSATLAINTGQNCPWTSGASPVSWMSTNNYSSSGPGNVSVYTSLNYGAARSAVLTMAGIPVTIKQAANTCVYNASPQTMTVDYQTTNVLLEVTTQGACQWDIRAYNDTNYYNQSTYFGGRNVFASVPGNNDSVASDYGLLVANRPVKVTRCASTNHYNYYGYAGGISMRPISPFAQAARVGTAFGGPIRFQLIDGSGLPVCGGLVNVSVVAGSSGASATVQRGAVLADSAGIVSLLNPIANNIAGDFTVRATLQNSQTTFDIPLTNTAFGVINSPPLGVPLPGSTTTFAWTPVAGVLDWWLDVGKIRGQGEIFGGVVATTSKTVTGIPCISGPIWARLYARTAAGYQTPVDFDYIAPTGCSSDPRGQITSPAANSRLASSTATFQWTAGAGALDYWLDVGTSLGIGNLFGGVVSGTSRVVTGLPCDGRQLYARLWTRTSAGYQAPLDYPLLAALSCSSDARALLIYPASGRKLAGSPFAFVWTPGTGAIDYWFDLGDSPQQGNYFAGVVTGTSIQVSASITCGGGPVHSRLWTRTAAGYLSPVDYTFPRPACSQGITSPIPSIPLRADSARITWYSFYTDNKLDVGTTPGGTDIASVLVKNATSYNLTNIPCNGEFFYMRLTSMSGNTAIDSFDQAAYCNRGDTRARLLSHGGGATGTFLAERSQYFVWTVAPGAESYWLDVGTAKGLGDVFGGQTYSSFQTVTQIPTGRRPIWVRLWTKRNGQWETPIDYQMVGPQ